MMLKRNILAAFDVYGDSARPAGGGPHDDAGAGADAENSTRADPPAAWQDKGEL